MLELDGYYLPKSLEKIGNELDFKIQNFDEIRVKLPILTISALESIVNALKINRNENFEKFSKEDLADNFVQIANLWKNRTYTGRQTAIRTLPSLSGYSPEMIEYVVLPAISAMDTSVLLMMMDFNIKLEAFEKFVPVENANSMIRAYASFTTRLTLKRKYRNLKKPELITHITPSNVPGLMEVSGIIISAVAGAASITKTPSLQPVFGPLYARSIERINDELSETIAVLPWSGGNEIIENFLFRSSDVVNVIGSNETIDSVKPRVDRIRRDSHEVIGCYHGAKFGLDVISKEYANNEDVATLAVLDAIGYEGYMCASPAFGFFVEKGESNPVEFSRWMAEKAEKLAKIIPLGKYFQAGLRESVYTAFIEEEISLGSEVFSSPNNDYLVVFEPEIRALPSCQNRVMRVMPIDDISQIQGILKPWKKYLQTVGVAIPQERLIPFAETVGKIGVTNIRTMGNISFPKANLESWDGKLPGLEFMVEDNVRWVSIDTKDIDKEILDVIAKKDRLIR